MIKKMAPSFDQALIIVDGLDECGRNTAVVVEYLTDLHTDSTIKTIFSSRDEIDIRSFLEDYQQIAIAARNTDLQLYVAAQIKERTRLKKWC